MPSFTDLFSQHVGSSFAHQLAFADFLGERDWSLTLSTGLAGFGDDLEFPIQLLGSEAHGKTQTWQWAWANEHIQPAPQSMKVVQQVRRVGEEKGIAEFSTPSFPLDVADGHALSLVVAGLKGNCCYYRGPYEGGAVFFLVQNLPPSFFEPVAPERILRVIQEVLSNFDVNHRVMASSFLKSQGFTVEATDRQMSARRDKASLTLEFDEAGRMTSIDGKL